MDRDDIIKKAFAVKSAIDGLLIQKADIDWFDRIGLCQFRTRRISPFTTTFMLPGPRDAVGGNSFLEVDIEYYPDKDEIRSYRYGIVWENQDVMIHGSGYGPMASPMSFPNRGECLISSRRCIHFDYHPHLTSNYSGDRSDDPHKGEHWHPCEVSEVHLPSKGMTPASVCLLAWWWFRPGDQAVEATAKASSDDVRIACSFCPGISPPIETTK
jgi:hypothetical protein